MLVGSGYTYLSVRGRDRCENDPSGLTRGRRSGGRKNRKGGKEGREERGGRIAEQVLIKSSVPA